MTSLTKRKGSRTRAGVPREVLEQLEAGTTETVNLMEWLEIDMAKLAQQVLREQSFDQCRPHVEPALSQLSGLGVTRRLTTLGTAFAKAAAFKADHPTIEALATHRSDIVRQWAVYSINCIPDLTLQHRLSLIRPFAADSNMSVRECAWMAFRPHLAQQLSHAIPLLTRWAKDSDPNVRRFAVEVTRPRSVWGSHLGMLKESPSMALPILTAVRADAHQYVRLAAGNWLNDAYKSQPVWVERLCSKWLKSRDPNTILIVRRALRNAPRRPRRAEPVA